MRVLIAVILALGILVSFMAAAQTSFEHAPGTEPYRKGMKAYESSRHWQALGHFRSAARWADKSAQFYLGAMHYRGEGVERDLARAWAWFELSAERDYPQMVAIADDLWDELDPDERERGREILEQELRPTYGDAATVQRTHQRMQEDRRRMTGSRLNTMPGLMEIHEGNSEGVVQVPTRSRYDFYKKENWDFYALLEKEAELMGGRFKGRVEATEFEVIEDEDEGEDDG